MTQDCFWCCDNTFNNIVNMYRHDPATMSDANVGGESEYKGNRSFSKKKYYELEDSLMKKFGREQTDDILLIFREIFKFDPTVSVYTEAMKASIKSRRERLKEQGISTYVSSGAKAYYEKKKQSHVSENA